MSLLGDSLTRLTTALTTAGCDVITDARNIRPGGVLIDPPTWRRESSGQVLAEYPVYVLVPPPGNLDALNAIFPMVDKVIASTGATAGEPSNYDTGGQTLPCYKLTVPFAAY